MTIKPLPGKRGKKSRRVRLEDIAKQCGVSLSTVSRALAGEKGVQPKTRQRIIDMAKKVNYVIPKSIDGQKVILAISTAAMIDYARNQFSLYVLDGVKARAQELNLSIVTYPLTNTQDTIPLAQMLDNDQDIIGVLSLTVDDENMLEAMRTFTKPVVLINSVDSSMQLSSVTPSNRFGATCATEHLIGLGHRRIVFLTRPGRETIEQRFKGWREALTQFGLPADDDLVIEVTDWLPELAGQALAARIDERGLDFTAVLAAGDSLAIGAMLELQQRGIRIPEQVSVMGIDDLPQVAFMSPALTSMHIPMREMGTVALNLLHNGLSSFSLPSQRVELACHLVERMSTGAARILS